MSTPRESTASEQQSTTFTAGLVANLTPDVVHLNQFNLKHHDYRLSRLLFNDLGKVRKDTGEIHAVMADRWSLQGDTLEVELDDADWTWHDGTRFTAADVVTKYRLNVLTGGAAEGFVDDPFEDIRAIDDGTVHVDLTRPSQESLLELTFIAGRGLRVMNAPTTVFGPYVNRLSEGEDPDVVIDELKAFRWTPPDPIGTGPFAFFDRSVRDDRIRLERYEPFPYADRINWPQVDFVPIRKDEMLESIMGNHLDTINVTLSTDQADQVPFSTMTRTWNKFGGLAMAFNHEARDVNRQPVRRALAWLTDRLAIAEADKQSSPVELFVGIPDPYAHRWVGDLVESTHHYRTSDGGPERAASLLRSVGYETRDGAWYRPDGTRFELPITVAEADSRRGRIASRIAGDYREFGIDAHVVKTTNRDHWEHAHDSDFVMMGFIFGDRNIPHPFFDFEWSLVNRDEPLEWCNTPAAFTVPPVGDPDADRRITIDVRERHTQFPRADPAEAVRIIRELAWVYNQAVPQIPLTIGTRSSLLRTDRWSWPSEDDPSYHASGDLGLIAEGKVSARTD